MGDDNTGNTGMGEQKKRKGSERRNTKGRRNTGKGKNIDKLKMIMISATYVVSMAWKVGNVY